MDLHMRNVRATAASAIVLSLLGLMGCLIGYYSSAPGVYDELLLKAAIVITCTIILYQLTRLRLNTGKKGTKKTYRHSYGRYTIPQHQFR
jgi:uncharacterized membrane protein YfcA